MYINGRKVTIEELQEIAAKLIGSLIDDVYESIQSDGIEIAIPGTKLKQRSIINKMIEHYIETEEYEKCAVLRDLIKY